jgi:hypothetical protein
MSKYVKLRAFYTRPHQERAMRVRQECSPLLNMVRAMLDKLQAAGSEQQVAVFGPRCGDLIDIAAETCIKLRQIVDGILPDGANITNDDDMRILRHDLRGPVGTLRNAMQMIVRKPVIPDHALVQRAVAVVGAAEEMRDIIEALTEDAERVT